jgi:hypothetical protein
VAAVTDEPVTLPAAKAIAVPFTAVRNVLYYKGLQAHFGIAPARGVRFRHFPSQKRTLNRR